MTGTEAKTAVTFPQHNGEHERHGDVDILDRGLDGFVAVVADHVFGDGSAARHHQKDTDVAVQNHQVLVES